MNKFHRVAGLLVVARNFTLLNFTLIATETISRKPSPRFRETTLAFYGGSETTFDMAESGAVTSHDIIRLTFNVSHLLRITGMDHFHEDRGRKV